jgi:hypothetical protein
MSANLDGSLRASVGYEHRKGGKLLSKGYSFGDWMGFTHLVQISSNHRMSENIFDTQGNIIKSVTYKGIGFFMGKLTHWLIKKR